MSHGGGPVRPKFRRCHDGEVHIERPDGSWVIVIVNIRPLKNQNGEITGALNYFFDINCTQAGGSVDGVAEARLRNGCDWSPH